MPRQNPTFTHEDLIRLYKNNLDVIEQGHVREFFKSQVFGGTRYITREIVRSVMGALEEFGRTVEIETDLMGDQRMVIEALVEKRQRERPRFKTGGGF